MLRPWSRFWRWPALLAGMAFCVLVQAAHADAPVPGAGSFLVQTESLRTDDHPRFLRMLQQLHQEESRLSPKEQWHLRYLDAWQMAFQGDYVKADVLLQDVIDHSGDMTLIAKSSALLMADQGINHRYEEAFVLANRLVADLPKVKDKLAHFLILYNVSQLLRSSGQNDLAIKYARMMEETLPPGETLCRPRSTQIVALYNNKKLKSSSPELQRAVDTCLAAKQTIFTNNMWLVMGSLYLEEGQPGKALALLHRIAPSISANQYYSHMLAFRVELAQAYWELADDINARKAALAA
ncbi:MAG TPA: GGDEF domain-containing protein, partial [Rhodanobacter sp.]|nr:GGDEF domain-containing protein [Rhodanobacter sp.]